jgi:hypothetical protein
MCADCNDPPGDSPSHPRSDPRIDALLGNPAVWRAGKGGVASAAAIPTGFAALDRQLPGGGWPAQGLIEFLVDRPGIGELGVLLPALVALQRMSLEGWLMLVSPPHEPYAPALAARGVDLKRLLVIRTPEILWTMEQALRSMVCRAVIAWVGDTQSLRMQWLRRLQLAAAQSGSLAVLCRPRRHARESSPAVLRLELEPASTGLTVRVLKSRGGPLGSVSLRLEDADD